MARVSVGGPPAGWVESLPALVIAMTGFFAILVGGVVNTVTVPNHTASIHHYMEVCQEFGGPAPWWPQVVLATSDFIRHHPLLIALSAAVFFTALVLLARRLPWKTGMSLAALTILIFLVAYPVAIIIALFPWAAAV